MKKLVLPALTLLFFISAMVAAVFAQTGADPAPQPAQTPATKGDPQAGIPTDAVHWTLDEIKAFETKLESDPATTEANPALLVMKLNNNNESVRRTSFGKSGPPEIHANFTDVFCILNGRCEFLVGGEVEGITSTNPAEVRGTSIKGGETKKLVAGDMIVIPPGIPHQILVQPNERVSFMVVKIAK